jgi:protein-tyrosine phosphatase
VIDLNAHLLPGIPGGPADMAAALAMARQIADAGTTTVVATPVLTSGERVAIAAADDARTALISALADAGVPLEVLPGAELTIDALEGLADDDLHACTLGGGGRWLLLALPDAGWPISLPGRMAALEMQGLGIVLAHVEQTDSVQLNPDRLRDLIGRGALVQVDAASFGGWNGARAERSAYGLLRAGMATFLASGARAKAPYPQGLAEGLDAAEAVLRRPRDEVEWMVGAGPRQVIAGQPVRAPRLVPVPRGGFETT